MMIVALMMIGIGVMVVCLGGVFVDWRMILVLGSWLMAVLRWGVLLR
tara:strand:- start:5718 stop:5858 length:141 start_codon:yes stop_codon:yes gene_type:complete